jgi:hypothetical protein
MWYQLSRGKEVAEPVGLLQRLEYLREHMESRQIDQSTFQCNSFLIADLCGETNAREAL